MRETVIVIDFGGQYNQLIARRIREQHVYCELVPYTTPLEKIKAKSPIGIVFTGGPHSVYAEGAPAVDREIYTLNVPILGICYGCQLMARDLGGEVTQATTREYGKQEIDYSANILFEGMQRKNVCWMSHTDYVARVPEGFFVTATTATCKVAAFSSAQRGLYGVQFHPEVAHTAEGDKILHNFLFGICGAKGDWTMKSVAESIITDLAVRLKGKKALCALSGGVDSAVCAALIHKACPESLISVFVDHGMLRKNEAYQVEEVFGRQLKMELRAVDASARFLAKLAGVTEPERKRKIIGEEFIRVFEAEAKQIGSVDYLVQGTIYPDVVESGTGTSAVIKSHHNVGGLPGVVDFKEIIEPLRNLFKDEVRALGREIGLADEVVMRQPFPGPGLAVRIIGDVTAEKVAMLQEADAIFREEIATAGIAQDVWQYFAVLTDLKSVGVMGDSRTYDYTVALRAVTGVDAMTADWARLPYEVLAKSSARIVNEVPHVNRVVYDVTSKPPATIEWE